MITKRNFGLILMLLLAFCLMTTFTGCSPSGGNDGSVSENKYLPNKFGVTIPNSLQSQGGSASSRIGSSARAASGAGTVPGYDPLKSDIHVIQITTSFSAMLAVLCDVIIQENGFTPSAASHGDVKVTATQDLIDRARKIYGETGSEWMQDYKGQAVTLSAFTYASSTVSPYDYCVSFTGTMQGTTNNVKLYWTSDKKKVKYSSIAPGGIHDGTADLSYLDNEFAYDDVLKGTAFVIYQLDMANAPIDSILKLREDIESSKGGIYVSDLYREGAAIDLTAYADNDGGKLQDSGMGWLDVFDAVGEAASGTAYDAKFNTVTAKVAEIPDLPPVKP